MIGVPLSMLDLPLRQAGRPPAEIVRGQVDLATRLEALGYHRVWYAEHHGSLTMADFPPGVVVSHVAAMTTTIRVGSGGVLAPNHVPLSVVEQFSALEDLSPGRVDLGIGRGPGTFDETTARALRRGGPPATGDEYDADVAAILHLLAQRENAVAPWLLSSSSAGAGLAARLGLPMAFAHHILPRNTVAAVEHYRAQFQPSRWTDTPRVMVSVATICADTDVEASRLARPADIMQLTVLLEGRERPLPSNEEAAAHVFTAREEDVLAEIREHQLYGGSATVTDGLARTAARFGADELMVVTPVYAVRDRARSCELVAASRGESSSSTSASRGVNQVRR